MKLLIISFTIILVARIDILEFLIIVFLIYTFQVTVADLMFIDSCESFLKLEPTCLDATPLLKALNQKVLATPKIKAYMESRPPNPF